MNHSGLPRVIVMLLVAMLHNIAAFQSVSVLRLRQRGATSLSVLYDPRSADEEFVEFPTPNQRATLKKEASKRQARKELATFSIPVDETDGPFSSDTLKHLWNDLAKNELVLVRGISKSDKKFVYGTAERLCAELETIQSEFSVTLLASKGHTATLYCPSLPLDDPLHVPLRTSVGQKNTWRARQKARRDNRGQIISD